MAGALGVVQELLHEATKARGQAGIMKALGNAADLHAVFGQATHTVDGMDVQPLQVNLLAILIQAVSYSLAPPVCLTLPLSMPPRHSLVCVFLCLASPYVSPYARACMCTDMYSLDVSVTVIALKQCMGH
jgi:hypothetical protein